MTKAGVNTSLETDYVTMKAEDKDGDNVKSPTNSNVSSEKRFGFGKLRSRSKQAITLLESIDASSVILAATKNTKVYKGVKCVEVASIIGGNVDGESGTRLMSLSLLLIVVLFVCGESIKYSVYLLIIYFL